MDQYRRMVANLLAERFGLVVRRVPTDFSGYEITVVILRNSGRGGPIEYVPVTNKTGLNGKVDFGLEVAASNADSPGDAPYLLAEALQKQLGLKLTPVKIKLDVIVVDHAEGTPTPN
jgi:uncharacterized protein (TIGR03435 family)